MSSRQISIIGDNPTVGNEAFTSVPYSTSNIKVAAVERLQDRFPEMKKVLKRNIFTRTRNDFFKEVTAITTPQEPTEDKCYITYRQYIEDDEVILLDIARKCNTVQPLTHGFVRAGPRALIPKIHDPIRAAIVTCGSLCPGQNEVIRELFSCLYYNYGVDIIYGVKNGFAGFYRQDQQPWEVLTPEIVRQTVGKGGSILGFCKGGFDADRILNACEVYGVNQLYLTGGDGTCIGAAALNKRCKERNMPMTIAVVPNSLENDLGLIDCSFGFNTAVGEAVKAIDSVVTESRCAPNGVGVVRITGKHAGYLAAHSVLAANEVDLCLIPETPFKTHGEDGILKYLEKVVARKGYAVVVVSEGAGSGLFEGANNGDSDLSVNFGIYIKTIIEQHFKKVKVPATLRYIDPSYMIRSVPASASDAIHCLSLSYNAVHASMAGYTNFSSAIVNNRSVLIPIPLIVSSSPSVLSLKGRTWERVLSLTQQPTWDSFDQESIKAAKAYFNSINCTSKL